MALVGIVRCVLLLLAFPSWLVVQELGRRDVGRRARVEVFRPIMHVFDQSVVVAQGTGAPLRIKLQADDYPNVQDAETALALGRMCANAYYRGGSPPRWYSRDEADGGGADQRDYDSDPRPDAAAGDGADMDKLETDGFGWERAGLRGHVYGNANNTLLVVAFKGTSTILMGGGTVARDRLVDNLMFSCCCAAVDLSWTPVCGCHRQQLRKRPSDFRHRGPFASKRGESGAARERTKHEPEGGDKTTAAPRPAKKRPCDLRCLKEAITMRREGSYLQEAMAIVQQCRLLYPESKFIFVGHSLGGALASLMTKSLRQDHKVVGAVTFAAPGDNLYADRLGIGNLLGGSDLRDARGGHGEKQITHFGLSSDPVFMGTCRGPTSSCYLAGYAMESKCRAGMECQWDVHPGGIVSLPLAHDASRYAVGGVDSLSSSAPYYNINTHRMQFYLQQVLVKWQQGLLGGPRCKPAPSRCIDCPDWSFS